MQYRKGPKKVNIRAAVLPEGAMDQRLVFDLFAAALLALTALVGAYAPVWLSGGLGGRGVKRGMAYSIGNMFSAGVMVSAGFCHLLADAERRLHSEDAFPWAPFLCALGFLLTLFADEVATNMSRPKGESSDPAARHERESDPGDCCASKVVMLADLAGGSTGHAGVGAKVGVRAQNGGSVGGSVPRSGAVGGAVDEDGGGPLERVAFVGPEPQQRRKAPGSYEAVPALDDDMDIIVHSSSGNGAGVLASSRANGVAGTSDPAAVAAGMDDEREPFVSGVNGLLRLDRDGGGPTPGILAAAAAGHSHGGGGGQPPLGAVSFITAVLMGIALCFHSLLEGAAMGAERTVSDTFHIFIAIAAHKGLAAYALGSSLVDSKADAQRYWAVVLFFVFATPVGIFLGYLVSEVASGDGTASISALAAGTFLYVAAMEVIPKELATHDRWFAKLIALMTGFGAMSMLAIWA